MFKIGEFSKLTQVSIRMLRYYDEVGLLKPAKIDEPSGYRLYSVEQIALLNKIIYLRDAGFQVTEMLEIIQDQDIIQALDKKRIEIEQVIQKNHQRLNKIELAKKELLLGHQDMHYQVIMKLVPSYQVLSLRRIIPDYYAEGDLWKEMQDYANSHHIAIAQETFSIYHDQEYKEKDVDVELCVEVKEMGIDSEGFVFRHTEAVEVASIMIMGPFSRIAGAYLSLADWLQQNNQYMMSGESRQIVHRGAWNEENPEHYLIEIQIVVKKI